MNSVQDINPPKHLKMAVLKRIKTEQLKMQMRKKVLYMSSFVVSGIAVFASVAIFGKEILASDFWSIASLAFSDMGTVATHWQDFGLSLLETLPVLSIIALLAPVFVALVLVNQYGEYQKTTGLKFDFKQ